MKRALLLAALVALLMPAISSATLHGISRYSDFTIFNDGSFTYSNQITVYNDQVYNDYMSASWQFYTEDLGSVSSSNMLWTGSYTPFTGEDPWQPGLPRTGYTRSHEIWVDALSTLTYSLSYSGSAGFWNFGDDEGVYYGDGFGGAQTPFDDFYFTLTLPGNATDFSIIDQSSAYFLTGTDPFILDWHENNVEGILANVSFTGENLSPTIPEPGTLALLGFGLLGIPCWRRFRK